MALPMSLLNLQEKIWGGQLPLEIRLASSESRSYDRCDPYLISFPRLSYLPLLLPRLYNFFSPFLIADSTGISPHDGYFTYDDVPLKWHLPLGLLYDIYALSSLDPDSSTPAPLPFKLVLHFSQSIPTPSSPTTTAGLAPPSVKSTLSFIAPTPPVVHDSFINAVKEADFLRSGTAKPIMSLSAADSKALWLAVQTHDHATYSRIQNSLLPPLGQFRNIPLRVYLPSGPDGGKEASIKVLQARVPPIIAATGAASASLAPAPGGRVGSTTAGPSQTLGTALHTLLPNLFPSRRTPVLAQPVLHGAIVPMGSHLEELARSAAYADGWLGVVVVMNT